MMPQTGAQTAVAQEQNAAAGGARRLARQGGIAIAATAFVALSAHISIPLGFTPVPITLQPFAVLLLGLVLAPGLSFAALCLYLMEGACGLPVFSPHGPGGIAQLFGPTGGYLLAAPIAAAIAGLLYRAGKQNAWAALTGAIVGDLVLLATGALWLEVLTRASFSNLLKVSVVPFLAGDAAKVMVAAVCAQTFASFSKRSSKTQ